MTRDEFLDRLAITFGQPDTADEALFIQNYEAVIGSTEPRVLAVAFSIIRDEHEFKAWPMPAVVRKAIASAALRVHGPARPTEPDHQQNPRANPSEQSRKRVADLVSGALQAMNQEGDGAKPKYPFAQVRRPGFEAMQRNSPNSYMHVEPSRSRNARNG